MSGGSVDRAAEPDQVGIGPVRPGSDLADLGLAAAPVAVLDLELTGLSPKGDRVCEIAIVRGAGGTVIREFQTLIRPGVPMGADAVSCTGITDAMLIGAPFFAEIAGDAVTALRGCVVVAHNVDFDLGFLHRELDGAPVVLPPPVTLDTLAIARRLFAFKRNGLLDACRELGVAVRGAHRALSDARAAFDLFYRMVEVLDPAGRFTVRDLADLVGALAPNSPLRLVQQQVLRDACRLRRTVTIEYQSTSEPATGCVTRDVDPWFVRLPKFHGYCHLRGSERVFRLERVRSVALTERTFELPSDAVSRL
ncbi:MAG: exonuclease domain-containing protein [Myxococcota bacterium]